MYVKEELAKELKEYAAACSRFPNPTTMVTVPIVLRLRSDRVESS